jgi:thymidine kinase
MDAIRVKIICGPMFSGKTLALVGELDRECAIRQGRAILYIHASDDRPDLVAGESIGGSGVSSHSTLARISSPNIRVVKTAALLTSIQELSNEQPENISAIGIDEGQFFEKDDLVQAVKALIAWSYLRQDFHLVVVAGLDGDAKQRPFPNSGIPDLLPISNEFEKLKTSVCKRCIIGGKGPVIASFTKRIDGKDPMECADNIGGAGTYESVCRIHTTTIDTSYH